MKSLAVAILPAFLYVLSSVSGETNPEAYDPNTVFTGAYGRAYMPYVPYKYQAIRGYAAPAAAVAAAPPAAVAAAAVVPSRLAAAPTRRFLYGVPAGGLYLSAGRPLFFY